MDAYAFIAHGHVFANAQTGNVVLFAVYASQADWSRAARHVPPVLACTLGIATAKFLGVRSKKRTFRATLLCQSIELAVVPAVVLFGSHLPGAWVVPILSFVAALQFTTFDTLGPWSFNSAMTTGNLKGATVGIVLWLRGEEREKNRGQITISAIACISFLAGALFGGFYTHLHPQ